MTVAPHLMAAALVPTLVFVSGLASAQGPRTAIVVQVEPRGAAEVGEAAERALAERIRASGGDVVDGGTVRAALHFELDGERPAGPEEWARLRVAANATRLVAARVDTSSEPWRVALTAHAVDGQRTAFGEVAPRAFDELAGILDRLFVAPPPSPVGTASPATEEPLVDPVPAVQAVSATPAAPVVPALAGVAAPDAVAEAEPVASVVDAVGGSRPAHAEEAVDDASRGAGRYATGAWTSGTRVSIGAQAGTEGYGYGIGLRLDFGLARLPTAFSSALALNVDVGLVLNDIGLPNGHVFVTALPMIVGASWRVGFDAVQLAARVGLGANWVFSSFLRNGTWSLDLTFAFVVGASGAIELSPGGVRMFAGVDVWIGPFVPVVFSVGLEV